MRGRPHASLPRLLPCTEHVNQHHDCKAKALKSSGVRGLKFEFWGSFGLRPLGILLGILWQ
eukprot:3272491-Amphidinium_carterae.2